MYLAGPVIGHTREAANDWRNYVIEQLKEYNIMGISPLRCEPPPDGVKYPLHYPDARFGTMRAIASKNVFDVRACDAILAYLPKKYTDINPVYGSVCELAWGHIIGKPTILVTDDPYIKEHPVINANAGWVLDTLDQGIEVATGILADYAKVRA